MTAASHRGRPPKRPPVLPVPPLTGLAALRALIPSFQALRLVAQRETAVALAKAVQSGASPSFVNAFAELAVRAPRVTDEQVAAVAVAEAQLAAAQAAYTAACAPVLAALYGDPACAVCGLPDSDHDGREEHRFQERR